MNPHDRLTQMAQQLEAIAKQIAKIDRKVWARWYYATCLLNQPTNQQT